MRPRPAVCQATLKTGTTAQSGEGGPAVVSRLQRREPL